MAEIRETRPNRKHKLCRALTLKQMVYVGAERPTDDPGHLPVGRVNEEACQAEA